jgi:hypothetical protein
MVMTGHLSYLLIPLEEKGVGGPTQTIASSQLSSGMTKPPAFAGGLGDHYLHCSSK